MSDAEPVNDNGLGWYIKGPDADGEVWFVDDRPGQQCMIRLGARDPSAEVFACWLEQIDYGERPTSGTQKRRRSRSPAAHPSKP